MKSVNVLNDKRLDRVNGGRTDETIRPPENGNNFWETWNPNFIQDHGPLRAPFLEEYERKDNRNVVTVVL